MKPLIVWQLHEGDISGANISVLEYIEALSDSYRFYAILPHSGTMCSALEKHNIPFSIIHQYGWADKKGNLFKQIKRCIRTIIAYIVIKNHFERVKPAFVFTNTIVPFVSAMVSAKIGIPHVWFIHEFGWEDFGFRIGWGKENYAFSRISKWSKLVVVNSDAVLKKFQPLLKIPEVIRIYQPVSWRTNNNLKSNKCARFLMFGQLSPAKGHLDVIEAFAIAHKIRSAKNLTLHIIGPCINDKYLQLINNKIHDLRLQDFIEIRQGYFDKEQILNNYETLIIGSYSEAFGRVIIEAKKAGLDVIARNAGGAPELLSETNDKLFVTINDLVKILLTCNNNIDQNPFFIPYDETKEILKLKNQLCLIK